MSPRYIPIPDDWPLLPARFAVLDRMTGRKVTTERAPGWLRFLTEGAAARAAAKLNRQYESTSRI